MQKSNRIALALLATLSTLALGFAGCSAATPSAPAAAPRLVADAPPPVTARSDALHNLATRFRAEQGVVGLRVAVLEDGELVYHGGLGFADREQQLPTTPQTLFRLGSISKPVTAAIAMQLVEQGKLDLDKDLRAYSPELEGKLAPLTLRQVLSHTSGIRHYAPGRIDNSTKLRTTREALELFVDDQLLFEPGAKYSYSTHAYTLAAHVLESASKQPFERLVRERVAKRGAPSLDCEKLRDDKPQRTKLYNKVAGGEPALQAIPEDNSWKYAGGGMEATVLDLARFGHLMLDDKLVTRASRERMWAPTTLADGTTSDYGLGWGLDAKRGRVSHSGSQQGCHCALVLDVEKRRVVAVMMNTLGGGAPKLADQLMAELAK
jgi:serine beta-lactamase-like protein LACTB